MSNYLKWTAVVDPADGRTVVKLAGDTQARASNKLLAAIRSGGHAPADSSATRWALDAWKLPNGTKQWSLPVVESTYLGDVWNGYYYFGATTGVYRIPLRSAKRQRELVRAFDDPEDAIPALRVAGGHLYYSLNGHEICGTNLADPQHAWRAYCDCWPEFADADGVYGTGTARFDLAMLRPDGKRAWNGTDGLPLGWATRSENGGKFGARYFRQFCRGDFTVAGKTLTIGGQDCVGNDRSSRVDVISPYLYAFHKLTGKLRWKKPMSAAHPVLLPGKVMVWAGHRRIKTAVFSPYGGPDAEGFDWRLETYDLATGRRLWMNSTRRDTIPGLAAIGRRYFVLERGRLNCYQ